ncbi:MAG: hypothetical protein ACP5QO_01470 [Clostridia bacterium]
MFLSFELRALRHRNAPPPFVVTRRGQVFDASLDIWSAGMDWGMPLREVTWRFPEASIITRDAEEDAALLRCLEDRLAMYGTRFSATDPRYGWVEIARPAPEDWIYLAGALVPEEASFIGGGLAVHPLLARWVTRAGAALKLPRWDAGKHGLFVCPPEETARAWASLPLSAVPVPLPEQRRWRQLGFRRVGEVEGLSNRLMHLPISGRTLHPVRVEEAFAEALHTGVMTALEQLSLRLGRMLRERGLDAFSLKLIWTPETGQTLERERRWPTGASEDRILAARLWTLIQPWPSTPPVSLSLEARETGRARPEQLNWWETRSGRNPPPEGEKVIVPDREVRFSYWDPWRYPRTGRQ